MSDFTQEQLRTLLIARENEIDRLHARVMTWRRIAKTLAQGSYRGEEFACEGCDQSVRRACWECKLQWAKDRVG